MPADLAEVRQVMTRVLITELGREYDPTTHYDFDHLAEIYLDAPRHALVVAIEESTGRIVGTAGVRNFGPSSPPHPEWIARRYTNPETAQLTRVYTLPEYRRQGIAAAMVSALRDFVRADGGYQCIYLHTNPFDPGALPFWQSQATALIFDSRNQGLQTNAVHFEMRF